MKTTYVVEGDSHRHMVTLDAGEMIDPNQLRMLQQHPEGLIVPYMMSSTDYEELVYDVSGFMTLLAYLQQEEMSQNQFVRLFRQWVDVRERCLAYMLKPDHLDWTLDHIYVEPHRERLAFVYLPISDLKGSYSVHKSLSHVLMHHVRMVENSQAYLVRLLNYTQQTDFHMRGFSYLLVSEDSQQDGDVIKEVKQLSSGQKPTKGKPGDQDKDPPRKSDNLAPLIMLAVLQCICVMSFLVLTRLAKQITGDLFRAQLGLGMMLIGIDLWVSKWLYSLLGPIKKKNDKASVKEKSSSNKGTKPKVKNPDIRRPKEKPTPMVNTEERWVYQDPNATTLLGESQATTAFLESSTGGLSFELKSPTTLFGRQSDEVDCFIDEMTVGRMHMQITNKEERYYLEDLYSKNGTYLNGKKLKPESLALLNDGDEIIIAHLPYVFRMPNPS